MGPFDRLACSVLDHANHALPYRRAAENVLGVGDEPVAGRVRKVRAAAEEARDSLGMNDLLGLEVSLGLSRAERLWWWWDRDELETRRRPESSQKEHRRERHLRSGASACGTLGIVCL